MTPENNFSGYPETRMVTGIQGLIRRSYPVPIGGTPPPLPLHVRPYTPPYTG